MPGIKHLGRADYLTVWDSHGRAIRFNADFGGQRWTVMRFWTISGNGSGDLCLAAREANAARARIGAFWMRCCGWPAPVGADVICRAARGLSIGEAALLRWIEMDVLDEMLMVLSREADLEWLMIDSTIVRAHQHAAGACRSKGGERPGSGSVSWRPEHQNPRRGRCTGAAGSPDRKSGAAQRHRLCT